MSQFQTQSKTRWDIAIEQNQAWDHSHLAATFVNFSSE